MHECDQAVAIELKYHVRLNHYLIFQWLLVNLFQQYHPINELIEIIKEDGNWIEPKDVEE